eukprot:357124-Chlamydomonas_euryale.AAC.2
MGEVAVELFQESPTSFLQVRLSGAGTCAGQSSMFLSSGVMLHTCLQLCPTVRPQELRKAKYQRIASADRDVLQTTAELHLPVESTAATAGITLLPSSTVESLLVDKRKLELVQPFKLALLKLASQVSMAWQAALCMHMHMHVTGFAMHARAHVRA